jgi:two-component system, OmpR family, copper resistance phosphate regulon response regulator CusR
MADTKSVLVIEDERPLSTALRLKLEHEGMKVTVAEDGIEGMKALESATYDVILMDLIMPGLDGFHVLEQLSKKPPMPKVFIISNLSQPEDEERVLKLGATRFFIKAETALTEIVDAVTKS